MKLKSLILAVLAGGALLVSCQQEKPIYGISTDKEALEFTAEGGQAIVQVTTGQAWSVSIPADAQDWLVANPTSGTGSASVIFTAAPNNGKDRKAGVKIKAGMSGYVNIAVSQTGSIAAGDGLTPATAWSASEANAWVKANLESGADTGSKKYYVKGKIHKMVTDKNGVEQYFKNNATYGNASFYISDDGQSTSDDFEAYRVLYLGNRKWTTADTDVAIGDEVIICGPMKLFGTTVENGDGAFIYSLNGNTEAVPEDVDYDKAPAKTVAEFIAAADEKTYYKLTGTVSGISAQYGNFDLKDESGTIYVYGATNWSNWKDKVKAGSTVTLAATYKLFQKDGQADKHEAVNAVILSCEEAQSTDTQAEEAGAGTEESPYNVSKAINAAKALTWTDKNNYQKVGPFYVAGKVSAITEAYGAESNTFGNGTFEIVDEGYTAKLIVYRAQYLQNKAFDKTKDTDIKVGDNVVVYAELMNYHNDTPETVQSGGYLYSLNGDKGQEDTGSQAKGTGTAEDPFNVAAAIAKAKETGTTATADVYFIKGKVKADAAGIADFKNATFDMVDEGYTETFQAYRITSFDGAAFLGTEEIKAGDEVVIKGKIVNYNNSTPETSQGSGQLVSINDKTTFGPGFVVEKTEISVSATATTATIKVLGNVAWTATSTDATVDPASGEGAGEITVTFAANTDTENTKTYKVTVATEAEVTTKSIEVTITQGMASSGNVKEDVLDLAFTGVSGSNYTEWSGKAGSASPAVYAGQNAGGNSAIQLRSNNNNSGIVSTTSGGKVKKIVVVWESHTSNGRKLDVYGSNTAYTAATDLYGDNKGTLIGSIVMGTSTELEVTEDFTYVGLRSNNGAMYITSITISWE